LGSGQQFVAYAVHPSTQRPYRWRRGEPMDTPLIDLPEIDATMAAEFVTAAEEVIQDCAGIPLRRQDKHWTPDIGQSQGHAPRYWHAGARIAFGWQKLDRESLANRIDARHVRRLKGGGWITACPAHASQGQRSLSIRPRDGGGSVVHCFADCDFREVARAIGNIVGGVQ
jgi:hypothetical protein